MWHSPVILTATALGGPGRHPEAEWKQNQSPSFSARCDQSTLKAGLTAAHIAPFSPLHERQGPGMPELFDWSTIEPSYDLEYTPCFGGAIKCARLLVPLDWSKHELNSTCGAAMGGNDYTVAVPIATLPATVPDTDPSFGGTVLYKPRGPGGASVDMPWLLGPSTQNLVDGDKHFEVITIEPRGVGQSTPAACCFDAAWKEKLHNLQKQTAGHIGSGADTFAVHFEYERAHGELCSQPGEGDINAHIGIASVARDMLHIVDKIDEGRRRRNELPPRNHDEELPKLQSNMSDTRTDRLGTMMVTGIFDVDAYRAGHWNTSMVDTETAIDSAYEACWDRSCPLRLESNSTPSDIRAKIDVVIADLDANSASVIVDGQIHVVRSETLRSAVLNLAYFPMDPFDLHANRIKGILEGNFTDAVTKMVPEDYTAWDAARFIPVTEIGAIIRCLDLQKPDRPLE